MDRIEAVERRFSKLSLEFENGGRPYAAELYPRIEQPDELLAVLAPGERMLSFFLGDRRSFLFSAAGTSLEAHALPPRCVIEDRVAMFLALVQQIAQREAGRSERGGIRIPAVPPAVFDFASRELYDILLGPVAKELEPGEAVIVIPDGLLGRLPFALLSKDGRYFVEDHDVSYAPSLRTLKYLRARGGVRLRSKHRPEYDVIAVGASGEGEADSAGAARVHPYTGAAIAPLADAEGEARAVGSYFSRSLVLAGPGAEESVFKQSPIHDAGILHIAAHAYVDDVDLRRSFIVFNPEPGFDDPLTNFPEDGLLQWNEAASLGLNAALVTLSSCHSAHGELARGEGITGFAQAFLYAGAGSVLASQLDVPDHLAGGIMKEYYRCVRRGMGCAAALGAAQRAALASGGALSRPAAWGAFCLIGDGVQTLPTDYQLKRLEMLLEALCRKFHIPAKSVFLPTDCQ